MQAARAVLFALRTLVPVQARPENDTWLLLPSLDDKTADEAAEQIARMRKPLYCAAFSCFDRLAFAWWPLEAFEGDETAAMMLGSQRDHQLAAPLVLTNPTENGSRDERLLLDADVLRLLMQDYVLLTANGYVVTEPDDSAAKLGAKGVVHFRAAFRRLANRTVSLDEHQIAHELQRSLNEAIDEEPQR